MSSNSESLKIAWDNCDNCGLSRFFNGLIDDVRIYNRALSETEIKELYTPAPPVDINKGLVAHYPFNGNANDESGNGLNGTVNGATLVLDRFGNADSAYSFDGITNFIDMGDILNDLQPPFSVSTWVNRADLAAVGEFGIVTTDNNLGTYYDGFSMRINQNGDILNRLGDGGFASSSSRRDKTTTNGLITVDTWINLTVVVNGITDMKIYVDGTDVGGTYAGSGGDMRHTAGPFLIGRWTYNGGNDLFFNGLIDDVRIYNKALSDGEVQAINALPN